jgi:hypothetical protein
VSDTPNPCSDNRSDVGQALPVPNKQTTPRSVRVDPSLWAAAMVRAHSKGETVTDVIVRALTRYTKDNR